jgi:hypothetical protein
MAQVQLPLEVWENVLWLVKEAAANGQHTLAVVSRVNKVGSL